LYNATVLQNNYKRNTPELFTYKEDEYLHPLLTTPE